MTCILSASLPTTLTWHEVRSELVDKLKIAIIFSGTMLMDAVVFASSVIVLHGLERLIDYLPSKSTFSGGELEAIHIALMVSTVGTGSAYVLKDLWSLVRKLISSCQAGKVER